jgi:hypothetical protein
MLNGARSVGKIDRCFSFLSNFWGWIDSEGRLGFFRWRRLKVGDTLKDEGR